MAPMILGEFMPNLTVQTTDGPIRLHDYMLGCWTALFTCPRAYSPVCTTELSLLAQMSAEFAKRGVKILAHSCDSLDTHIGWIEDMKAHAGLTRPFPFPIIADEDRRAAAQLGLSDVDDRSGRQLYPTCRAVMLFGPKRKLKLNTMYPVSTGFNMREVLRSIDSLQLIAELKVIGTPEHWGMEGYNKTKLMLLPSLKPEEAAAMFPAGVTQVKLPSGRDYVRYAEMPEARSH